MAQTCTHSRQCISAFKMLPFIHMLLYKQVPFELSSAPEMLMLVASSRSSSGVLPERSGQPDTRACNTRLLVPKLQVATAAAKAHDVGVLHAFKLMMQATPCIGLRTSPCNLACPAHEYTPNGHK